VCGVECVGPMSRVSAGAKARSRSAVNVGVLRLRSGQAEAPAPKRTGVWRVVLAGVAGCVGLAWGQCAWAALRMRWASFVWPVLLYDEQALDL